MPTYPKTGERRRIQRPLHLDHLPAPILDRIRAAHDAGRTWAQIEHESPHWKEWDEVPEEVEKLFAGERGTGDGEPFASLRAGSETVVYRLPHSSLQRWHDPSAGSGRALRREQAMREREERAAAAHAAAEHLAARGFTDLTAAVKNALGEAVFELMSWPAQQCRGAREFVAVEVGRG